MNNIRHCYTTCMYACIFLVGSIVIPAAIIAQEEHTLKDRDGNLYTIKLMADNNLWITQNLAINIAGSYCYNDSIVFCKKYNRLYTWKSAIEGCSLLGNGWRLPTDTEWQQMVEKYGGIFDNSADSGKTAYQSLSAGGSSGFNALLAGGREAEGNTYARIERHGFYWTATEDTAGTVFYYNFGSGRRMLFRQDGGEKGEAFAVRCIKKKNEF